MADTDPITSNEQGPEFVIQRIYTKDLSFEAPHSPQIFKQEWKPELNVDLQTRAEVIEPDVHQVELMITVTVKSHDKVAFIVEVKEAGIFLLRNFPADQLRPLLGSVCPSIIYPYAREVISDIVVRGGFPQLNLAPINFESLYQQHLAEEQARGGQPATKQNEEDNVH